MEGFIWGNYRGYKINIVCPLCYKGPDYLNQCFKCEVLTEKIEMQGEDMNNIYLNKLTAETSEIFEK